jgi:hypothetical protein
MKRLFTFGCSFTNYRWSTWADCLAPEFEYFENWGQAGAGNHYIFNSVMEADQRHEFSTGDTVIVCWTNVMREDRYIKDHWVTLGNIMTTPIFTKEFVTDAVCERGNLIRDLAFIKATHAMLTARSAVTCKFISMCPILQLDPWEQTQYQNHDAVDVYANVLDSILPSFTTVLGHEYWNTDRHKRFQYPEGGVDYHPTPNEHLTYLDTVLPGWVTKDETRVKIHEESLNLNKDPRRSGMTRVKRL